MKDLLSILLVASFFSCDSDSSISKNKEYNYYDSTISDYKGVYGKWSMCSMFDGENVIQTNTCKTIAFNTDGSGYIGDNALVGENFTWTLKIPGMKIISKSRNSTFPDTFYYADFAKKDERISLTLRHKTNSYYLSKNLEF